MAERHPPKGCPMSCIEVGLLVNSAFTNTPIPLSSCPILKYTPRLNLRRFKLILKVLKQ